MHRDDIKEIFERQAATYDTQWAKIDAISECLRLLICASSSALPDDARILCVGCGTGAEILAMARMYPRFHFTAVEPAAAMIDVATSRLKEAGIFSRCELHHGYLESLPEREPFHAATCLLVSQFIKDQDERAAFFSQIARLLLPGAALIHADLCADLDDPAHQALIELWMQVMMLNGMPPEGKARLMTAYRDHVAVLPEDAIVDIVTRGGFSSPSLIFQAGLIRAWRSLRA